MELTMSFSIFSLLSLVLQIAGQQVLTRIMNVRAGESVTIKCPIVPDTSAFSAKWTLGCEDEDLYQHQHYKNRTILQSGLDITINNLIEEDSGIYFCHVDTSGSKRKRPGTILVVTPAEEPAGNNEKLTLFILFIIIGLETCIIFILLAVHVKHQLAGSSDQKNKPTVEPEPLEEICYTEVSITQRPRTRHKEEKTIYTPVKLQQ